MVHVYLYSVLQLLFFGGMHGIDPFEGGLPSYDCLKERNTARCNETFLEAYSKSELAETDSNINPAETSFFFTTRGNPPRVFEFLHRCGTGIPTDSLFNCSKQTVFLIHGFIEGVCTAAWMLEFRDQLLFRENYNVIIVDWSKWSGGTDYYSSVRNTQTAGKQVAFFISRILVKKCGKTLLKKIHIIGHSLGAHVAGIAGKVVQKLLGEVVRRISGLDPAGPGFRNTSAENRLNGTDAGIVDVIHANAGECAEIGYAGRSGTADFHPNGGSTQLSCVPYTLISFIKFDVLYASLSLETPFCFHKQSVQYFKVSINACNCQFIAVKCPNYEDFKSGKCTRSCGPNGTNCAVMGMDYELYNTQQTQAETYYLDTTLTCPYCDNSKIDLQGFPAKPPKGNAPKCFPDGTA